MCDNEYLAQLIVKERLCEAEARGAVNAMLRQASTRPQALDAGAGHERPRPRWQVPAAWVAHLTLPKIWNRL